MMLFLPYLFHGSSCHHPEYKQMTLLRLMLSSTSSQLCVCNEEMYAAAESGMKPRSLWWPAAFHIVLMSICKTPSRIFFIYFWDWETLVLLHYLSVSEYLYIFIYIIFQKCWSICTSNFPKWSGFLVIVSM